MPPKAAAPAAQPGTPAYRDAMAAGASAFKDGRLEKAVEHYKGALAAADGDRVCAAEAEFQLGRAHLLLKQEDAAPYWRRAITAKPDHVGALKALAMLSEKQQDFGAAEKYYSSAIKASKQEEQKEEFRAKLAELKNKTKGPAALALNKERYGDFRRVRFDVGRLLVQQEARGLQDGDAYYLVPVEWFDAWRAHVGGFERSRDMAAWMRIAKASKGNTLELGPSDPLVLQNFMAGGITEHLPPADEAAAMSAALEGNTVQAPGPAPGPVDTRPLLRPDTPEPTGGKWEDSEGKMGPRLKAKLVELADYMMVDRNVWELLKLVYGTTGPAIIRYVVPKYLNSATEKLVSLYPESGRYPMPAAEDDAEEEDADAIAVRLGMAASTAAAQAEEDGVELEKDPVEGESGSSSGEGGASEAAAGGSAAGPGGGAGQVAVRQPTLFPCSLCGSPADSRCPKCRLSRYCSSACQKAAWPLHKPNCAKYAEVLAKNPRAGPPREVHGLTGLHNLGNTCFMNSSLQALSSVWPLTEYFLKGQWEGALNPANPMASKGNILAKSYAGLLAKLWLTEAKAVSPTEFKASIARFQSRFSGFQQHDAQELLNFLLDGLHEDLNGSERPYVEDEESKGRPDPLVAALSWEKYCRRNRSRLLDLFAAQLKSTLVCPTCSKVSVKFDPYWTVPLPIPTPGQRTGPRQVEVLVTRLTWDPQAPAAALALPAPGAEGAAAFQAKRALVAGTDIPGPEAAAAKGLEEEAVKAMTENAADEASAAQLRTAVRQATGKSADYTSRHRVERYIITSEVDVVAVDALLQAVADQTGLPPSRLALQTILQTADGPQVQSYFLPGAGQTINLSVVQDPFKKVYAYGAAASTRLHFVEMAPPDWRVPRELAPPAVHEGWAGREAEEKAEAHMLAAPAADDEADKAFLAARDPLRRGVVLARVFLYRGHVYNRASRDMMQPDKVVSTAHPVLARQGYLEGTPLMLSCAPGMSVTALRLAVARELYGTLEKGAKAILKEQKAAGADESEDVEISNGDALLYIASCIHIATMKGDDWLPGIAPNGEDAPGPAGAMPGTSLPASTTPLSKLVGFEMFKTTKGNTADKRVADFVWGRVHVHVRGELAFRAYEEWAPRTKLDAEPLQSYSVTCPSFLLAAAEAEKREESSSTIRLESCFDKLKREEVLDKDNMWFCPHCKEHVQATKKLELWSMPDFLVLQLKRFENVRYRTTKVDYLVNFPLRGLDLSAHHSSQLPANASFDLKGALPEGSAGLPIPDPVAPHPDHSLYDCVAVVNHFGGAYGGHYTAYANHEVGQKGAGSAPGAWHYFDDSRVGDAIRQPEGEVISKAAYVLVYRRRKQMGRPV